MKKGWMIFLSALLIGILLSSTALADKKITLTFTGDVTLGSEENKKNTKGSFHWYAQEKGYAYFMEDWVDLFSSDDLTMVNLEGPLTDSFRQENKAKTYRFRGPREFVRVLTSSSVEACNIANNHTRDFGNQGYNKTVATLEEAGIKYCGNDYYFVFEKDGVQIAFFGLVSTKVEGSKDWVATKAQELRDQGVDAVVVCFHAGIEYNAHRSENQERYANLAMRNMKADLVIMHHSHVAQGIDIINNRYVCYSLGNFCFGGNMTIRALETIVVQADMIFEDDGTYKGQQLRIYPAHIATSAQKEGDANDFRPKRVTGEEALAIMERVQNDSGFELGLFDEDDGCLALRYLPAQAEEEAVDLEEVQE